MCGILGYPPPTEEQRLIIESPLETALVIAGAGSGKTATLVLRILWLIVSGVVKPESVMGLTFTRKAAGELSSRLQQSLAKLGAFMEGLVGHYGLGCGIDVMTYNSFASSVYQDNALLLGHPTPYTTIDTSEVKLLARRILLEHGIDEDEPSETIDNLAASLVRLDDYAIDNLLDLDQLNSFAREFIASVGVFSETHAKSDVLRVEKLLGLSKLIPLLRREKKLKGRISYSEQVAFALEVCKIRAPREFQERISCVVLDEYQDTSPIQVEFLKTIFGSKCKALAACDPRQAIFGFRGASSINIANFPRDFLSNKRYELSISWRNDKNILRLANHLSSHSLTVRSPVEISGDASPGDMSRNYVLRTDGNHADTSPFAQCADAGAIHSPPVAGFTDSPITVTQPTDYQPLRARPDAACGSTQLKVYGDVEQEVQEDVLWLKSVLEQGTVAVLTRTRSRLAAVARGLDELGVPYRRSDSNIFYEPEVVDLVAFMRIINSADDNLSLLRLITGPRWQVGMSDLRALYDHIAQNTLRRENMRCAKNESHTQNASHTDNTAAADTKKRGGINLLEGLSYINIDKTKMSQEGKTRIKDFLNVFHGIKQLSFLKPLELAYLIEESLNLDIEVQMSARGRENLNYLYELIASFKGDGLDELLAWFTFLEADDSFRAPLHPSCPGQVELLTTHSAKGLEWDWVLMPFINDFPVKNREKSGWLSKTGALPFDLRLDRAALPSLSFRDCSSFREYRSARKNYENEVLLHHLAEERKLFYVGVTRARKGLRMSAFIRSAPGEFLQEVSEFLQVDLSTPRTGEQKKRTGIWPLDPLGARKERLQLASRAVESDYAEASEHSPSQTLQHTRNLIDNLHKTHESSTGGLEKRISVTALSQKRTDMLPQPPIKNAWLGSALHLWIENYYSQYSDMLFHEHSTSDAVDFDYALLPESPKLQEELDALKRNFLSSEWAGKKPVAVELSLEWLIGDMVVPCAIDAVFFENNRYTILDWKSGLSSDKYRVQLSLYRLAFAEWKGIDPEMITTKIYFAASNKTVTVRPHSVVELGKIPGVLSDLFSGNPGR